MTSLCYTNSEISAIESLTRKQSENKNWFHYRKCAVTSSKIHNIYTRVKSGKTLLDNGNNDWLIEDIMDNSKFKGNINTAYGLIHEKDAASDYLKEKQKTHIGCNLIEKGLIFSNEGWFATSVDRIFSCFCCMDKIIVEIKCPKNIENKQTSDFINSINYLKPDENGQALLIPSHTYYTQIQSQMAITKIHKADFVVGPVMEL
ncbi:hypothetical protein SNE40_002886 [Patella caerulea]|uniref:YqaJ viral recombinase domain-containing protein n=1 Tax=Patella caerulea TaxID=87958 RepID=A0AAN8K6T5_PATCE